MISLAIIGRVEKGLFIPDNKTVFRQAFWKHEGKRVLVQVKRYYKKRSLNQNDYGHGVLYPLTAQAISEAHGETVTMEQAKEILKHRFLKVERNGLEFVRPTSELNTAETEEFYENCRRWVQEFLNFYIPEPNEAVEAGFII